MNVEVPIRRDESGAQLLYPSQCPNGAHGGNATERDPMVHDVPEIHPDIEKNENNHRFRDQ
jgi:hypothetical protein